MELIEKIAYYTSKDPGLRKSFSTARAKNIGRILEIRAARGAGYSKSSDASNNFDLKSTRKRISKGMERDGVAGKSMDENSINNSTGNPYMEDKINRFEKIKDDNYVRSLRNKTLDNYRRRNVAARDNNVLAKIPYIGDKIQNSKAWGYGTLGAGVLGAGALGYALNGGESPEELANLHEQANQVHSGMGGYALPLGVGAGALGAKYILDDRTERRRALEGRNYNPYNQ